MEDSVQDEADEVAEVLRVEGGAVCSAHQVANSQRNVPGLRHAVVAVQAEEQHSFSLQPAGMHPSGDQVLPQGYIQGDGPE